MRLSDLLGTAKIQLEVNDIANVPRFHIHKQQMSIED